MRLLIEAGSIDEFCAKIDKIAKITDNGALSVLAGEMSAAALKIETDERAACREQCTQVANYYAAKAEAAQKDSFKRESNEAARDAARKCAEAIGK